MVAVDATKADAIRAGENCWTGGHTLSTGVNRMIVKRIAREYRGREVKRSRGKTGAITRSGGQTVWQWYCDEFNIHCPV